MINEFIISLFLISILFIMYILSSILFNIKKKKGIISLILCLIFTFFASYYVYLVFYQKMIMSSFENYEKINKIVIKPELQRRKSNNGVLLNLQINNDFIKVGLGDEIEIKKNTNFIISNIEGIDKENFKVNLVGFVGNKKYNDGNDIGYKINYKDMKKDKEISKDKYEIKIKKGDKEIGSVYIKFVD
ncbi:MAG: hypothetical protein NC833_04360 [Candidatus Omnitrophica bacterium]|nr:hypothetical protein [Candidatus Omnitrophota bacterium]